MLQGPALLRSAPPPAEPIPFALVGWGWRAQQFAEIARLLPAWFRVTGLLRRIPDGSESVPLRSTMDELLRDAPRFAVLSVPRSVAPGLLLEFARRGAPVLAETPPAADLEDLRRLWRDLPEGARVQVAEQYPLQPYHQAVFAVTATGRLGKITQVQASVAHDYHGLALIRRFLGTGRTPVKVRASAFPCPVVAGPNRSGAPSAEKVNTSPQVVATLDFGQGRIGVHDFVADQYMSWIRSSRLLLRGERGEVAGDTVRWLPRYDQPARQTLSRIDGGTGTDLQGLAHKGYVLGSDVLYLNPFPAAPLPDDFIAMASTLWSMEEYLNSGVSRYGLADGCHDHAVALRMHEAARSGAEIEVVGEPWMEA